MHEKRGNVMDIYDYVDINDCPICFGASLLEEEGNSYYVMCTECGCHSVNVSFKTEDKRIDAAQRTAMLWNSGKVIKGTPGE